MANSTPSNLWAYSPNAFPGTIAGDSSAPSMGGWINLSTGQVAGGGPSSPPPGASVANEIGYGIAQDAQGNYYSMGADQSAAGAVGPISAQQAQNAISQVQSSNQGFFGGLAQGIKGVAGPLAFAVGAPLLGGALNSLITGGAAAGAAAPGYAEGWSGAAGAGADPTLSAIGAGAPVVDMSGPFNSGVSATTGGMAHGAASGIGAGGLGTAGTVGAAGAGSSLLGGIGSGAGSSLLSSLAGPIAGSLAGSALSQKPYSGPTPYQPTNQAGMDASYNQNYNTTQGLLPAYYGNIQPLAQQSLNAAYNNPYASGYQQNAMNLAGMGQQAGAQNMSMANQLYQTAMDPQQALYQKTLQQIQDQARAANSAAGIGTSGAGVGLEDQAVNNFNIAWQNQQLQRQLQGSQGAGNLQNQGLGMVQSTYGLPYQAGMQVPAGQQQALGQYTQNIGAYPSALSNQNNQAAAYMGLGQAAQGQAFNQGFQNAQAQNQQAANIGSGIAGAFANYNNNQTMNNMINAFSPYYGASSMSPTLG